MAEMGRRTRQRLAEWLRQLDQEVVVGLRGDVEAEQRVALARLLRWCGREHPLSPLVKYQRRSTGAYNIYR